MSRTPKRFGPEWWCVYAATFTARFEEHMESHGFDAASAMRSCHAEHAAAVADEAVDAFLEAVEAEAISVKRRASR